MLRIAHVSDLHVLAPLGVELRRVLFNKRITGYANMLMKRARVYRREYLLAVLLDAAAQADQLVVTGDITNLSLEGEYREACRLLADVARSAEVTVVPGNHDTYLPAIHRERRFPHHFAAYFRSDLPELALDLSAGPFPSVKLRGPVALIGLSSAVPRPPFVSAGYLGPDQLAALQRVLQHPEVGRRTAVVLVHHSPFDSRLRIEQLRGGLVDARALRSALMPLERGLVLYGHLHVRRRARLPTSAGALDVVCASAAALDHPSPRVRAGYNLYDLEDDGRIARIEARVLDPSARVFERVPLPLERGLA
ncbi:MAG TPA: metallophosphoesterase [Polyangiales bacterium]|nr:metallophosphoesterase [Polyangiales bacterium]